MFCCSSIRAQSFKGEDLDFMKQMSSRTAKQTWWFFDKRLKEPLHYNYLHVYLEFQNVYLKDIKQLPSGKYLGVVDLELPHDPAFDASNLNVKFDSTEIDDWFMVEDVYLIGGFQIRLLPFQELQLMMKKGKFKIPHQSVNEDFIAISELNKAPLDDNDNIIWVTGTHVQDLFPGGIDGFKDSVGNNLVYTEYAHYMGIEGFVTAQFSILKNGGISNIKILRGVGGGLSDTAKNTLNKLGQYWKPFPTEYYPKELTMIYTIRFYFRDYEQTFK
jgi:hypothetical protein